MARYAESLTVVDSSPETMALNKARVAEANDRAVPVRCVQADIFAWTPDGGYDVVFFSFWLSHVPPERFEAFWAMVRGALNPGGRVFFVDSLRTELSTANDHVLPGEDDIDRRAQAERREPLPHLQDLLRSRRAAGAAGGAGLARGGNVDRELLPVRAGPPVERLQ